jgi:hypothetical protein
LIETLLSSVFCWLNPALASELARKYGFDGIEILVGRKARTWPNNVRRIHPTNSFIGQRGVMYAIERVVLGNIEGSPIWRAARDHGIPLVLHEDTFRALGLLGVVERAPHGATILVENTLDPGSLERVVDIVNGPGRHFLKIKALIDVEHLLHGVSWLGERIAGHLDWAKEVLGETPLGGVHICGLNPRRKHSWLTDTECNVEMLVFVADLAREHRCPVTFEPSGTRSDQFFHVLDRGVTYASHEALEESAKLIKRYLV